MVTVSAHLQTYGVSESGDVWTWGTSRINAENVGKITPTQLAGINRIQMAHAASSYTLLVDRDGVVWGVGALPLDEENPRGMKIGQLLGAPRKLNSLASHRARTLSGVSRRLAIVDLTGEAKVFEHRSGGEPVETRVLKIQ
jgi:hypothetical protein